jgi:hypothetical protein
VNRVIFISFLKTLIKKIWRYLDFPKFISLLYSKQLFFPRASLFEDLHEGAVSQETNLARQKSIEESIQKAQLDMTLDDSQKKEFQKIWEEGKINLKERQIWKRNWTYVSCWHMNDCESAAMWKIYGNQAIAIRSTYNKLFTYLYYILQDRFELYRFGEVNYINYQKEKVPDDGVLSEYFCKRKSFIHEAEFRIVIQDLPIKILDRDENGGYRFQYLKDEPIIDGISTTFDFVNLIDKIYVAPTTPDWLYNSLQDVLIKYDCPNKLKRSSFDIDPIF